MTDPTAPVDINTATTRAELLALPRIKPSQVDRILAGRPFASVEDLQRVKHLGPKWLERLRPFLVVSSGQENSEQEPEKREERMENREERVENGEQITEDREALPMLVVEDSTAVTNPVLVEEAAGQSSLGAEEPPVQPTTIPQPVSLLAAGPELEEPPVQPLPDLQPVILLPASLAPEEPPAQPTAIPRPADMQPAPAAPSSAEPKYVSWSGALTMAIISGLAAFLLAVVFILGTLTMLNGGLSFARPSQLTRLQNQIDTLNTQADDLQQNVSDLDSRLSVVEGLDGRMTTLEDSAKQLRTDTEINSVLLKGLDDQVDGLTLQAQNLDQKVQDLSLQVDALLTRTGRFQKFMDGLRELLNGLAQP